jgi:NhaP-type Na+/H+ or K+/H+ antiporter
MVGKPMGVPCSTARRFLGVGLAPCLPTADRRAIVIFGVKGIGSLHYLAHALGQEPFPGASLLWPTVAFTVLVSIVVHGVSATPIIRRIDRRMGRVTPEPV